MDRRQRIPGINRLAEMVTELFDKIPHEASVRLARYLATQLRADPKAELRSDWIRRQLAPVLEPGPVSVINGTGILLHTNQGRAPLDRDLVLRALDRVAGYTDLELSLDSGKRSHRDRHFAELARLVWGVEDATLVNNAAAAVALTLAALGGGRETVVSRGELIEIGGSFRLPDIMEQAGTKLVEVGATNKTKIDDYHKAITDQTGCLLKTHTSNYRIEGFTAEVSLEDMVKVGREHQVPVVMDLGSGLSGSLPFPAVPEPFIEGYLDNDPDLLIFSGDKLFGSVQSGIVLGKRASVEKLRKHPMMRMLRQDKLSISIICHQLHDTFLGRQNPLSQLACATLDHLRQRAESLAAKCNDARVTVVEDDGFLGGGSLPQEKRPSISICIAVKSVASFSRRLRLGPCHLMGYVRNECYFINMAGLFPHQDERIAHALIEALKG